MPGIPTVFYGDEAGLEGYSDPFNRMPYPWGREESSLLEHYRKMGKIRRENNIFSEGSFKLVALNSDYLIFRRSYEGVTAFTVCNNSDKAIKVSLPDEFTELRTASAGRVFEIPSGECYVFVLNFC